MQDQLLKGVLDLALLTALREESYGYALVEQLRRAGLSDVADASVYGTLKRLEIAGYVTARFVPSPNGPQRKYYRLTASGTSQLRSLSKDWHDLVSAIGRIGRDDDR